MDYLSVLAFGFMVGLASRPNLERLWNKFMPPTARPPRLRKGDTTVFGSETGIKTLEPTHRWGMWKVNTWAFMFQGEQCTRALSAREMYERTGLTRPKQVEYLNVLSKGGVIMIVPRSGVKWTVGKVDRRKLIDSLPYPTDHDPPIFTTLGAKTLDTVGNRTDRITESG